MYNFNKNNVKNVSFEDITEVYMSPKNEYFCTTPKNGSAQECGSKGGLYGNISARKSNITARIQNKALFLHGEITNLSLIIQCIDFVLFLLINGT